MVLSAVPKMCMLRLDLDSVMLHLAVLVQRGAVVTQRVAQPDWATLPRE
ncbi:hypothetical protein N9L19_00150 [bacterium]|nr:hypothetical protein [bacterium]